MQPGYRLSKVDGNPEDVWDANFQVANIKKRFAISVIHIKRISCISGNTLDVITGQSL